MLTLSQTVDPYAAARGTTDDAGAGVGGWVVLLIAVAVGAVGYAVGYERGTKGTTSGTRRRTVQEENY